MLQRTISYVRSALTSTPSPQRKMDYLAMAVAFGVGLTVTLTTSSSLYGILVAAVVQSLYGTWVIAFQRGEVAATSRWNEQMRLQVEELTAQATASRNGQVPDDVPTGGAR